ncbi:MAG: LuxR C-terminal-related transcriptional regulator [Gammaproteobacteria bacterium]|nr:LuxR C-terminal-related transcriptional regulator [Gammaproteobacteria bacterium]MDH5308820.1 LuxR C-terminal-related transcriptional regulator [Gammaproteobacteria bacterium]
MRERLLAMAPEFSGTAVTLVSAPAGFGKSTLVSHWLDHDAGATAWLSLESEDSDLRLFASYVVAALSNVVRDCCVETVRALHALEMPDAVNLAGLFCNDLDSLNTPVVLVLDDYHKITAIEVHEFLDAILRHPPRGLHIVIVTRRDPPLALQSLRASAALTEIRMRHLAFNESETLEFMRNKLGDRIADRAIAHLHERTEGWPVGLRLAALAIRDSDAVREFVDRVPSDIRSVRAYLMHEVLAKCPETIRDYLLCTAFLDRFNASIGETVCKVVNTRGAAISGRDFTRWIDEAGLFSIALDDRREWFRYHHLFQTMLQEEATAVLDDADIREVHLRAARWFEANGFFEEAIRHLMVAGASGDAAELIIAHRNEIMNNEEWHRLANWLSLLPSGMIESRPELLLLKARLHRTRGAREEFAEALDAAETLLETTDVTDELKQDLLGSLESSRCFNLWLMSDGTGAVASARRALDLLPEDSLAERGFAMIILGGAMQMTGDTRGALDTIYAAMPDESSAANRPTFVTRLLAALCFVRWMDGDLGGLRPTADQLAARSSAAGLLEVHTIAEHFLAASDYHHNHLQAVVARLKDIARSDVVISAEFHANNMIIAGLAHQERGEIQMAADIARHLHELALKSKNVFLVGLAEAFESELALRTGRLVKALEWANRCDPEPLTSTYGFFSPTIVLAKVLVIADNSSSRGRAKALLDRLVDYLATVNNRRFLIEALALRAMLHEAMGNPESADDDLLQALRLAQPSRFIRLFIDLGPRLGALLSRMQVDEEGLAYVGEMLAAFQPSSGTQPTVGASEPANADRPIVEPLSYRERQILTLLAERLSNKEIADKLHISTATVKRHAANIYQKLGVHGRRHAVAKANGLGILTRPAR